jgi:hypothetical protein
MNKPAFFAAGALAVALAGVAYYSIVLIPSLNSCTSHKNHCIRVTVDDTNHVQVDVPELRKKKGAVHHMWWHIDEESSQHLAFDDLKGIYFDPADNNNQPSPFTCAISSKRVFYCEDTQNTIEGRFKYRVLVKDAITLDPYIYND